MTWLTSASHRRWLESETDRLLDFGRHSRDPRGGFGYLDASGQIDGSRDVELWISCRMTHVYALGSLLGRPGCTAYVDHGVDALLGRLRDAEHGGWFASVGSDGPTDSSKEAYGHAFVILAAASAKAAGRPDADALLEEAIAVHSTRFWDDDRGMCRESFSRDWSEEEDYRGVNANMHTVEAYLAAADVLNDPSLLHRALRITARVVDDFARDNGWRLPEHYDAAWQPLLGYNSDEPAHPFRPFGATVGHALEWSRLTVQVAQSLQQTGHAAPEWMIPAARELYDAAVRDGWNVDGHSGFVYTTDWEGAAVVRERMHWVVAEAIGAAAVLARVTKDAEYAQQYQQWWDYAGEHLIDWADGSWHHELSTANQPSAVVWPGKPDLYHALQATLLPRLPPSPALAASLAAGNLDR